MIAGGLGNIRSANVDKAAPGPGGKLMVLGGPAMLIGLGGGAASSQGSGAGEAALDFASVQRGNAEMQRSAQEVIDTCWALGEANPIAAIHDIGAGGLSNAVPEIVEHCRCGAMIELRADSERRAGHEPHGALVQRIAGAVHARDAGARRCAVRRNLRARALPVCRDRRAHRGPHADRARSATSTTSRSQCRWKCCSASRRR